jgi:hypothetical protein
MRSVQAAVALAALTLTLAASAAVDLSTRDRGEATPPRVALIGGLPIQQARCAQWNGGGGAERQAVVAALASTVGGPSTSGGHGTTLAPAEASALFNRACANPIARGFLLYELYIRAAGFRSLVEPPT